MERGLLDEDATDESLSGLKRRECASSAACAESGHIEPDVESDGAAPCSAAGSLRPGGDDAEVGPETAPQEGQAAQHVQHRHKWPHLGCTDAETFIKYR